MGDYFGDLVLWTMAANKFVFGPRGGILERNFFAFCARLVLDASRSVLEQWVGCAAN
jgi:hypothetical protein